MKKTNILLSLILIFSLLCGCTRPLAMQDVKNIVSVDYSHGKGGSYNYYSFDIERGVFRARADIARTDNNPLDDSPEYELKQTEIEAIRDSIEPVGKWPSNYKHSSLGKNLPHYYSLTIKYADGTQRVFTGTSANGTEWPEGFEELKRTFDGITFGRLYEKVDPAAKEKELTDLLSDYNPVVQRNTDEGYDDLGDGGYSIRIYYGDEVRLSVDYSEGMFWLALSNWGTSYSSNRMGYEDLVRDLKACIENKYCVVTIWCDGEVINKFSAKPDECGREKLIGIVNSYQSKWYQENIKKYGYRIEGKYCDKSKDFVYTVDPES